MEPSMYWKLRNRDLVEQRVEAGWVQYGYTAVWSLYAMFLNFADLVTLIDMNTILNTWELMEWWKDR